MYCLERAYNNSADGYDCGQELFEFIDTKSAMVNRKFIRLQKELHELGERYYS